MSSILFEAIALNTAFAEGNAQCAFLMVPSMSGVMPPSLLWAYAAAATDRQIQKIVIPFLFMSLCDV